MRNLILLSVLCLAACGQTGALVLPDHEPAPDAKPAPVSTVPLATPAAPADAQTKKPDEDAPAKPSTPATAPAP